MIGGGEAAAAAPFSFQEKNMDETRFPAHIAVIMDGNGRWAERRGLPRRLGHKAGCETLEQLVEDCARLGVKYFTVYAFSTENWKRSQEEIGALMQLFRYYIPRIRKKAMANDIRVMTIGDPSLFDEDLRRGLEKLAEDTAEHRKMTFIIALNYGGRAELVRAVRKLGRSIEEGILSADEIGEEEIAESLDTAGIPDPDLLIRTSGEERLSNFLLWQCAYAEFYFTDTLWPDFHREELLKAIEAYRSRDRRYGGRTEAKA